jgi:hypothetical protein
MYDAKRIIGVTGRAVAIMLVAINSATVLSSGAFAAEPAAASPKVRELATQLAKEWLKEQGVAEPAAGSPAQQTNNSLDDYANSSLDAIQDQVVALARAIPDLPNQFKRAVERITAIDADSGRGQVFLDLGIFGDPYYLYRDPTSRSRGPRSPEPRPVRGVCLWRAMAVQEDDRGGSPPSRRAPYGHR